MDIKDRARFDIVRYASCWEDADILAAALDVAPGERVISIASGGDNSLALLAAAPEVVVAVDLGGPQIAMTELKRAAFMALDHGEMLRFLGFRESDDRRRTFAKIAPLMSAEARELWEGRLDAIDRGAIHVGKFEGYFHLFRTRVLPLIHGRADVAELMREKPVEERRRFYDERWDTWRWRLIFRIFFSRAVLGRAGRDPEFFRYVEGSVAERILERVRYALTELPTHDNPYMRYILTGNFGDALPRYARPEHFEAIRDNLGSLRLVRGSLEEALAADGGKFDGFNLSDIFEYMDMERFDAVADTILRHGNGGARLAYWNMLVPREIAGRFPGRVERDEALSRELFARDRAFFYKSFFVERVVR